ncbi:PQ loop repeat-domain-containing protein [Blastocladiella britannica]|nr:PQ loop repeat-domain-containing protein [Blastocladiella britannica]
MSNLPCICNPAFVTISGANYPYSQFFGTILGECVYSPRQFAAEIIGLLSIVGFAVSFVPQVWHSYQRKSVQGLTFSFFLLLAAGDMVTLLGTFLTQQFATQKWLAVLFGVESVILGVQFTYYSMIYPRLVQWQKSRNAAHTVPQTDSSQEALAASSQQPQSGPQTVSMAASLIPMALAAGVALARRAVSSPTATSILTTMSALESAPLCDATPELSVAAHTAGWVTAWISAGIFLVSRIGQIRTNYKLKSSAGMSLWFVLMLFSSNVMYSLSVF